MDSLQGSMGNPSHSPSLPPEMNQPSLRNHLDLPPTLADLENDSRNGSSPPNDLLPSPSFNGSFGPLLSPNAASKEFNLLPPSPCSPSFKAKQSKKTNPLIDLIESEGEYVDHLAGIVRKVAAAWSRSNFPPKELDLMFRGIEAVYKANRSLLAKLKDIGPNPSSPKALGDLLMRWIDDLDKPYYKYCTNYLTGFDTWRPILVNEKLPIILSSLSVELSQSDQDTDVEPVTWTLDSLFALPRTRLKYYKRLYARLLKSTQPGRSDHKLLESAVSKLEGLLIILSERENSTVGNVEDRKQDQLNPGQDNRSSGPQSDRLSLNVTGSETADERGRISVGSSVHPSSISSGAQGSPDAASDPESRVTSTATMSMPISHLEKRLSTNRVLDIFTLKPKVVRLQMNPPSLPFTRSLRMSADVEIHFSPRMASETRHIHKHGHIFLLTDLFLVAERMTPEEKQAANLEGQDYDMWLLYPPLAGKHLRILEVSNHDSVIQILILKKETLILHTQSRADRDLLIQAFKECIEAGTLLAPRPGQPAPPPVPALNFPPRPTSTGASKRSDLSSDSTADETPKSVDPAKNNASVEVIDHNQNRSPISAPRYLPTYHVRESSASPATFSQMSLSSSIEPSSRQALSPDVLVPPPRDTSHTYDTSNQPGLPGPLSHPSAAPGPPRPGLLLPQTTQSPFRLPNISPPHGPSGTLNSLGWPGRPPSGPLSPPPPVPHLHKSPSSRSLGSSSQSPPYEPIPGQPGPYIGPPPNGAFVHMPLHQPLARAPFPPSTTLNPRVPSFATTSSWPGPSIQEPSPPTSPIEDENTLPGPVTATVTAQFKCKVFLKVHHGQWKSLGGGRLKLYLQQPMNIKQLVVENDSSKDKSILISTIVLTDGVERVGKTGVAIELSDKGVRLGVVYMIQLRNETSASGLFDSLLEGSDRAAGQRL